VDVASATGSTWSDPDFDFLPQVVQTPKQPFSRKSLQFAAHQCRDFRLVKTQQLRGLRLSELSHRDYLANRVRQLCFGKHFLRIVHTNIGKDVSTAVPHFQGLFRAFHLVAHYAIIGITDRIGQVEENRYAMLDRL